MAMNQTDTLYQLIGRGVKVNRGGPDSIEGNLLSVQSDHLVVRTKDGIVYINSSHVKSISLTSNSSGSNRSNSDHVRAHNFQMLLYALNRQFVQINRGGPEKIDGFMIEANESFVTLVVGREIVRIPVFHIKSISVKNNSKGNKSNKSNKSNNNNKSNQSHKSNRSNKSNKSHKSNRSNANSGGMNRSGTNPGAMFQQALILRLLKRK